VLHAACCSLKSLHSNLHVLFLPLRALIFKLRVSPSNDTLVLTAYNATHVRTLWRISQLLPRDRATCVTRGKEHLPGWLRYRLVISSPRLVKCYYNKNYCFLAVFIWEGNILEILLCLYFRNNACADICIPHIRHMLRMFPRSICGKKRPLFTSCVNRDLICVRCVTQG
jgi:hypothetical protein